MGLGIGQKVFVYLKHGQTHSDTALHALSSMDVVVRGHFAGPLPKCLRKIQSDSFHIGNSPIDIRYALRTADVLVIHGGVGTVCNSLIHGIPVFALPTQIEQRFNAIQIQKRHLGSWADQRCQPEEVGERLTGFLQSQTFGEKVKMFAEQHLDYRNLNVPRFMANELERLL